MKPKTLLLLVMTLFIISVNAQKKEKQPVSGYAITAVEKGARSWKEVKLVDMTTGQELRSIYKSANETEALNARTKKPVVKKNISPAANTLTTTATPAPARKKVVNLDDELNKAQGNNNNNVNVQVRRQVVVIRTKEQPDKPFSTNSAAMAYDKKHDRLYYTPMNISQLRYIDLKSGNIYYFEDEPFGVVKGHGDVQNQITRMVIASDGNGYALSNDGNHLIRFTTGKKPTITDLGALSDDVKNEKFSIHSPGGYGGDMVADANENLYLITANRNVFKISIQSKVAVHLGSIKGLPRGFSTNGAMVEEGSNVIVASSESTEGYFRFDLNTLLAEKVSQEGNVFNASDLANGNLAFEKKKKDKKQDKEIAMEEPKPTISEEATKTRKPGATFDNNIAVYPNPVTNGTVKVSFTDLPAGKYQVQLLDLTGRLVSSLEVNLNSKLQVADLNIPEVAKGNYLVKVVSKPNNVSAISKLVVQ
ncbi:MAG TPA: T9SS type A sorting domain-containing protein [Chitinophagaceae bacterium]